jgi:hypothetical protein
LILYVTFPFVVQVLLCYCFHPDFRYVTELLTFVSVRFIRYSVHQYRQTNQLQTDAPGLFTVPIPIQINVIRSVRICMQLDPSHYLLPFRYYSFVFSEDKTD